MTACGAGSPDPIGVTLLDNERRQCDRMKGLSGVAAGLIRRSAGMTKGMQRTLDRLKAGLESSAPA